MLKNPILTHLAKITGSSVYLVFKSLTLSGIIYDKSNIRKFRGPNIHVVFSPKKNF